MKRLGMLLLLLVGTAPVWAQVADSSAARTLGDTPRPRSRAERNVLGAPVYYDTLGNVLGTAVAGDSLYHRPPHHFRNRLENEYNRFFFEFKYMLGGDFGMGGQIAYVPQRWGFYASGVFGFNHEYFSAGPVLRLSDCGDVLDWQLYGGLTLSRRPGAEVGFRLAGPRNDEGFAWSSFSMGAGFANRDAYLTLGFSLLLMPDVMFFLWL